MRILAFDSTAVAASVCLLENGNVVGEFFINTKLTHSRTLMPMARSESIPRHLSKAYEMGLKF